MKKLLLALLLLASPALAQVVGPVQYQALPACLDSSGNHLNYTATTGAITCGTSSSGGGSATGRTETPMTIASGTHTTGIGAAFVFYTSPGITLAAGQHITLYTTVFLDGFNATMYVGLLDGSGHGYVAEIAPSAVTIYRSTGPSTNANLGSTTQTKIGGWQTLQIDIWPDPVSQVISAGMVGGAQVTFKSDVNYPISTGTWFPAIAAFTAAGAPTFTNIRSGWYAIDR